MSNCGPCSPQPTSYLNADINIVGIDCANQPVTVVSRDQRTVQTVPHPVAVQPVKDCNSDATLSALAAIANGLMALSGPAPVARVYSGFTFIGYGPFPALQSQFPAVTFAGNFYIHQIAYYTNNGNGIVESIAGNILRWIDVQEYIDAFLKRLAMFYYVGWDKDLVFAGIDFTTQMPILWVDTSRLNPAHLAFLGGSSFAPSGERFMTSAYSGTNVPPVRFV